MAKNLVPASYFNEPIASSLEARRDKARLDRRIIFDCLNASVDVDHRVHCRKGYKLRGDENSVPFRSVLRGWTPGICQQCPDYKNDYGSDDGG